MRRPVTRWQRELEKARPRVTRRLDPEAVTAGRERVRLAKIERLDRLDEVGATLTVAEVSHTLGVSTSEVDALIRRHELGAVRLGNLWRVPVRDLDALLAARRQAA
jgi:excisionase family DNA binding protein